MKFTNITTRLNVIMAVSTEGLKRNLPLAEEHTETMNYSFKQHNNTGIFTLSGELISKYEDDLKLVLMRALHGTDHAVLNLKDVTRIDPRCLKLLRNAYCTSIRLRKQIILTEVPIEHIPEVFNCETSDSLETVVRLENGESTELDYS